MGGLSLSVVVTGLLLEQVVSLTQKCGSAELSIFGEGLLERAPEGSEWANSERGCSGRTPLVRGRSIFSSARRLGARQGEREVQLCGRDAVAVVWWLCGAKGRHLHHKRPRAPQK